MKPSVFEITVTPEEKEKINEPRLTKDFIDDCLKVAQKLKRSCIDDVS